MEQKILQYNSIEFFLNKGILVSSDAKKEISKLTADESDQLYKKIKDKAHTSNLLIITEEILEGIKNKTAINTGESKNKISLLQKEEDKASYNHLASSIIEENQKPKEEKEKLNNPKVQVLFSYDEKPIKRDVSHFTSYFRKRYKTLEQMLQHRNELQNRISISRAKNRTEKDAVSVIGMVSSKHITKNNNIIITIEDLTGSINIIINKNREADLFLSAKECVFDEVIGVVGVASNGVIFVNKIISPDIPLTKEFKKSPNEEFAVFIGDPHIGSKHFLKKEFIRMINWINGRLGDDKQKIIASKVKYLFVIGDMVDGVGIYPGQEEDLSILDIYEQYDEFTRYLKQIPSHIKIIICPGNHDAMRIAEPQPKLSIDYAKELYSLSNVTFVSNPSLINIGATNDFEGFDVLIYHGYSFTYYADTVESIRSKGGLERADLIMRLLLKKRHLSPSHTSNLYIPDQNKDPLIIYKVPDFFVSGHIHRTTAKNHNNITLINGSCWIGQTPFQEKVGLKPQPARLPIVNLQTREIKIIKFGKDVYTLDDNK